MPPWRWRRARRTVRRPHRPRVGRLLGPPPPGRCRGELPAVTRGQPGPLVAGRPRRRRADDSHAAEASGRPARRVAVGWGRTTFAEVSSYGSPGRRVRISRVGFWPWNRRDRSRPDPEAGRSTRVAACPGVRSRAGCAETRAFGIRSLPATVGARRRAGRTVRGSRSRGRGRTGRWGPWRRQGPRQARECLPGGRISRGPQPGAVPPHPERWAGYIESR